MTCAVVALANGHPEAGILTAEITGADIRPVGKRSLVILKALP